MARRVLLLRGVNVGGHRRIAMSDLRAALEAAGHEDVRTHLQSGNVVLTSDLPEAELAAAVERLIETELGVPGVVVVVRSRDELAAVVAANPFPEGAASPKLLHVSFLTEAPAAAAVEAVEALDLGTERVAFRGREVYSWHPDGYRDSALAKALGKHLRQTATDRNWSTVTKLLELAGG